MPCVETWFTPERLPKLLEAARSWVGTPFHPHAYVKGPRGGCSCQTCVAAIYIDAGFAPSGWRVPEGPIDWGHASKKSLIAGFMDCHLVGHFDPVQKPAVPGDLLGFEVGGCVHHLGILLPDRKFVHCLLHAGVCLSSTTDATWAKRLARIWRPVNPI